VVGFINARFTVPQLLKWEADVEAMLLQSQAIRDIEAILELAGTDLVLLPSGNVLARAVFEIALKAAWLVQPEDPYEREVRWLVHLEEDARVNEKVAIKVSAFGGNDRPFQERGTTFRNFAQAVAAKLPPGYRNAAMGKKAILEHSFRYTTMMNTSCALFAGSLCHRS
jgi:hypothetical protein